MQASVFGALVAFAGGVALSVVNDRMTRAVYQKKPSAVASFFVVRQALNIAYLMALYFLSPVLPWEMIPLLVGGALGITIPSIFLAARLAKRADADQGKREASENPDSEGKER